jgi:hypothetical protein
MVLRRDSEGLNRMMVADVKLGPVFTARRPRELFKNNFVRAEPLRGYDIAPDGRFLVVQQESQSREAVTKIHITLNWFEELKRLVPTN